METTREIYVDDLDTDELRDGFLVTSHRKKLWNVQINLMKEVARICEKYGIRWFAISGTLLGAVRHKGFVPWDDDVDIAMLRPDYAKFQEVAKKEIREPYFLDVWYDYRLESEGASLTDCEGDFQFITAEQEKKSPLRWLSQWPSIRIRDNRTTMIEIPDRNFINQGIFVDIFPLDPWPPFKKKSQMETFNYAGLLTTAAASPERIRLLSKENSTVDYSRWNLFISMPYRVRGKFFEKFMLEHFFSSECLGDIWAVTLVPNNRYYFSKAFDDVVYLPFEKIEVPAPADYESVLDTFYGDWRKPVMTHLHSTIYSADIPYKEFFDKAKL